MVVITCVSVLIVLIIIYHYVQCLIILKKSKLPSLPLLPLLGHCHYFFGPTDVFYKKIARILKRANSFGLFIGPLFSPLLYDVDIVSHLIHLDNSMLRKSYLYNILRTLVNRTIFQDTGTSYKESKRVLLKAMGHVNLQHYNKIFIKNSKQLVKKLKTRTDEEINLDPELDFCVVSAMLESMIGSEALTNNEEEIDRMGSEISNYLRKTCERLVLERKAVYEKTLTPVLIDTYFTTKRLDGEEFTTETIVDDVITLLGAGVETTVSSLGFIIMLLAMNQGVQKRVIEEIESKIPEEKDDVSTQDLSNLPYLDQVVHEAWRLYPPASAIGRTVTTEVDLPNGGSLVEGTNIWFCILKLHRDPKIYPNPNEFNPDNFLPEKIESRPQGSYIPFGFGARKCIGNVFAKLVIKATIYQLLRNYTFHTTKTVEDFRLALEVTLKNKIGVPVILKSRNKA
ncbi:hypothetical protein WA026_005115 [Henosepilachna vigintioctopunctata]|uniref:Cytochrome P450 n=1 Tax=Henosepilachna vigintioctopunctata TaxID=420089 RepID=A0AAW1UM59_9CUCU